MSRRRFNAAKNVETKTFEDAAVAQDLYDHLDLGTRKI